MTLVIVLAGLMIYLGLAVVVGRFCGVNSAWERAVEGAMTQRVIPDEPRSEVVETRGLEEAEQMLNSAQARAKENKAATQPV